MLDIGPLATLLVQNFAAMSPQLQVAARFLLDHPNDVALLSMRDQAKRAGVPPATMTRLAQKLGFAGYDEVRSLYAESVRRKTDGFADRAGQLVDNHRAKGKAAVAVDLVNTVARQLDLMRSPKALESIVLGAECVADARRVCIVGRRSSYPVAYQLAYACGLIGCEVRLVDGPGGIGIDHLHGAGCADVLVVISIRPYSAESLTMARYAVRQGVPVVTITDSALSPFASLAKVAIVVGVESPSFFHTMVPAFAAVEALTALVAATKGEAAKAALAEREAHFEATDALLMLRPTTKSRRH